MLESSYLKEQFEKEYSREEWSKILREIFNATLLAKPKNLDLKRNEWDATGFELGSFETLEGRQVGIFEIDVPRKAKLQHNRKGLRDLLKNEVYRDQVDAALLVFKQDKKWRFSYVSQIRVYNKDTGKRELKVTEPKRYTYLMGEGERCLTAAKQFAKIQMDTNLFGKGVTLETIHNAFSVEKMSKEFFDEYRRQYGLFTAFLTGYDETNKEKNPASGFLRSAFSNDTKAARDFVKKTLGRIVFLYFLEKKGWLGVPQGEKWGKGDDNFLSNLYKDCKQKGNFYSDVLVPLFFRTLNRERADSLFDIRPDILTNPAYSTVKVPYLNGGLFEEDSVGATLLTFPQHLFKGLFDFFDQYNFTVYEDSPDEHTVAVDPEMLGHIFENLLEDNKDKGTYYTPKEIVHYMCQESLIEYLCTKLEGSAERRDIERFIKHQEAGGVAGYSEEILQALFDVKICDPAIGSGAFPMGLLMEILHAVETMYFLNPDVTEKIWSIKDWEPGKVKAEIIQNSIYGVDIEQGAVDIARLRFWLSLVVDEEVKLGENPKPLPNLDYKIVVGNSLISKLDEQVIEIDWNLTIKGNVVNDVVKNIQKQQKVVHKKLKSLFEKQLSYFDYEGHKTVLKEEIRLLKIDVLIEQIQLNIERNNLNTSQASLFDADSKGRKKAVENMAAKMALESAIIKLNRLKVRTGASLHFFDWKFDFPEIMNKEITKSETGFDIVIGNPPYGATLIDKGLLKQFYSRTSKGNIDSYKYFIDKGLVLLKDTAALAYIVSDSFLEKQYFYDLRSLITEKSETVRAAKLGDDVFDEVNLPTALLFLKAGKNAATVDFCDVSSQKLVNDKIQSIQYNTVDIYSDPALKFSLKVIGTHTSNTKPLIQLYHQVMGVKVYQIGKGKPKQTKFEIENDTFISTSRKNKLWIKFIDSGIKRYFFEDYEKYIKYGEWLAEPRIIEYFNSPKIILREVVNPRVFATYFEKEAVVKNTNAVIIEKSQDYNLKYLLAILNSNYFNNYIRINSPKSKNKLFPSITSNLLKNFPVVLASKKVQQHLSKMVDKILREKESDNAKSLSDLDREINLLVYKLYDIPYEEASIIEGNTEWMSREDYEKL